MRRVSCFGALAAPDFGCGFTAGGWARTVGKFLALLYLAYPTEVEIVMTLWDEYSIFDSIVAAVLPGGQGSVVALSHVYFDESGTHEQANIMSLAGYWFDATQAARFSRDWAKVLKSFGIKYAHMTDCALGFGQYKNLMVEQRIELNRLLIGHIKRRSKFRVAICINPNTYANEIGQLENAPHVYTYLIVMVITEIIKKMKEANYKGRVAYFFESGHNYANAANQIMNLMVKHAPEYIGGDRYAGHSFVNKEHSLPLKAADMLAWQVRHYEERKLEGKMIVRKDLQALRRPNIDILLNESDWRLSIIKKTILGV
jgi:Protein of unknown function (DUF3800)